MRCPSPCGTPMTSSGDRLTHRCKECKRIITLRDPSVPPKVKRYDPDEEIGWSQESDDVVIDMAPSKRRAYPGKVCPDCTLDYTPKNAIQVRCTACAVARRRLSDGQRKASDVERPLAVRFTAKLLRGAA